MISILYLATSAAKKWFGNQQELFESTVIEVDVELDPTMPVLQALTLSPAVNDDKSPYTTVDPLMEFEFEEELEWEYEEVRMYEDYEDVIIVDLSSHTSTPDDDTCYTVPVAEASDTTYHMKDDMPILNGQSLHVETSVDNFDEESDVSKSLATATIVTATSSVDGLHRLNSSRGHSPFVSCEIKDKTLRLSRLCGEPRCRLVIQHQQNKFSIPMRTI